MRIPVRFFKRAMHDEKHTMTGKPCVEQNAPRAPWRHPRGRSPL